MSQARPVRIISEVPPTRTEGSERLINELADALASVTHVETLRIPLSSAARWSRSIGAALRPASPTRILHYFPIGSLTRGALVRARLWRHGTQAPLLFHAFQQPAGEIPSGRALLAALGRHSVVVSPSPALVEAVASRGVAAHFVPSSVNTEAFRPPSADERWRARAAFGVADGERVVLHVGHVRRNRNLGAFAALTRMGCRVMVVVSPRLPADADVLGELTEAGVRLIHGSHPDIRTAYWAADVYAFPVMDPRAAVAVPLSVLEALACGLPVVTTRFDGLVRALGESPLGVFWAGEGELPLCVKAALQAAIPPHAVAAQVAARFSLPAISDQFMRIYRSLTEPQVA